MALCWSKELLPYEAGCKRLKLTKLNEMWKLPHQT